MRYGPNGTALLGKRHLLRANWPIGAALDSASGNMLCSNGSLHSHLHLHLHTVRIYVWLRLHWYLRMFQPCPSRVPNFEKLRLRFTLTLAVNKHSLAYKDSTSRSWILWWWDTEGEKITSCQPRDCVCLSHCTPGKDLKFILYCFRLPFLLLLLEEFGSSEVNDWMSLSKQIILPRIFMHGSWHSMPLPWIINAGLALRYSLLV